MQDRGLQRAYQHVCNIRNDQLRFEEALRLVIYTKMYFLGEKPNHSIFCKKIADIALNPNQYPEFKLEQATDKNIPLKFTLTEYLNKVFSKMEK